MLIAQELATHVSFESRWLSNGFWWTSLLVQSTSPEYFKIAFSLFTRGPLCHRLEI